MFKRTKIIRMFTDFPHLNKFQIADRVGCHPAYVTQVQKEWRKELDEAERQAEMFTEVEPADVQILTGGSSDYYKLPIKNPTSGGDQYIAECNDIIEALGMNYAEGNAFKAVWRHAALRQGHGKPGSTLKYEAEKVVFFGQRLLEQVK